LGRFLSFDPVGGNPAAPQSWNRYAYVLGNPLKYTDPHGLFPCGEWECQDRITVVGRDPLRDSPGLRFLYGPRPGQGGGEGISTGFGLLNVERAQVFYQGNFEQYAVEGNNILAFLNFGIDYLFVPESQAELGIELAMAVVPAGKVGKLAKLVKKPGKLGVFKGTDALRRENKVVRDVARKLKLSRDQQDQLHREISGDALDYHEILETARAMFGGG
jgi:hypothetical protein